MHKLDTEHEHEPVAVIEFTDGQQRHVFQAVDGQYVIDGRGQRVYGVWFIPEEIDPPAIIDDRQF